MKVSFILMSVILVSTIGTLLGNESESHKSVFPRGISIENGLGIYAVKDEYISKERYSGTVPYFRASWSRFHNKYGFRIGMGFSRSTTVKNYNISAEIVQFSTNLDYLYPLAATSLFSEAIYLYLGPSSNIRLYYNNQNIATQGGLDMDFSVAMFFSAGLNLEVIVPLQRNFQVEYGFKLDLLSLGIRSVDVVEEDILGFKLLTPLSGTNAIVDIGLRFFPMQRLSFKFSYKFQLMRIKAWDYLISASDNLALTLSYHF